MSYTVTEPARADLAGLLDAVAADQGLDTADRLEEAFVRAFRRVAEFPHIGHARKDLTSRSLRFWQVRRWMVVYQPSDPVLIVRVLHGARDVATLLDEG